MVLHCISLPFPTNTLMNGLGQWVSLISLQHGLVKIYEYSYCSSGGSFCFIESGLRLVEFDGLNNQERRGGLFRLHLRYPLDLYPQPQLGQVRNFVILMQKYPLKALMVLRSRDERVVPSDSHVDNVCRKYNKVLCQVLLEALLVKFIL